MDLLEFYSSDGVVRPNQGTTFPVDEGKTRQEFKAETDINNLMKRGEAALVPLMREQGLFADVSQIGDLHDCLEKVRRAGEVFMALPAEVRSAFDNEPALFTKAFETPEGQARLRELKVLAELPEVILERQEAAIESRSLRRSEARALAARIAAAQAPPTPKE